MAEEGGVYAEMQAQDWPYQEVLLELAALDKRNTSEVLRRILYVDAVRLPVDRVNLWSLELLPLSIRCEHAYPIGDASFGSRASLLGIEYPRYFQALLQETLIAAEDAHGDPRTSELAGTYLVPMGIGAMLDVPVWVAGRLVGVLCHERVGTPHAWTQSERTFALAIGQIVATTLEVRERCNAEAALRDATEQRGVLAMREEAAREQLRARDEFFSIAAHELYTPLASLQLAVDALRTGRTGAAETARSLTLVDRQVKRLTQLASSLLDVSRIRARLLVPSYESFDLNQLLVDVIERSADIIKHTGCPLDVDTPGALCGTWDRSRLDQVFSNLLSNAAKFGNCGRILIRSEKAGAWARVQVQDHGIGIPPERLPYIFERFERAVSMQSYGGLGLGLFIVRGIVRAHGGTVFAESTLGKGTTITVELPLQPPAVEVSG